MSLRNRREFLEDSMFAAAAAVAAGSATSVFAADEKPKIKSPNEKLGVAVVGCGGRGSDHIKTWTSRPDTEILYLVDVDENIARQRAKYVAEKQGREPKVVADMREAFDDKSSTSSPPPRPTIGTRWSAFGPCRPARTCTSRSRSATTSAKAGESSRRPASTTRICQTGTQSRSNKGMQDAMQYVHDGKIGKVNVARGLCYKRRRSIGPMGNYPIPKGVNYDLWLGPAPVRSADAAQFALRLALAVSLRQRRPGQPGHSPDGPVPLGLGRRQAEQLGASATAADWAMKTPATPPTRR